MPAVETQAIVISLWCLETCHTRFEVVGPKSELGVAGMMASLWISLSGSPTIWPSRCTPNWDIQLIEECWGTIAAQKTLWVRSLVLSGVHATGHSRPLEILECKQPRGINWSDAAARADMRKAMRRDVNKESVVPLKRPIRPEELEFE